MRSGFIGLGAIGAPLSRGLLRAGVDLAVYDADPERAREVAADGAALAASAKDAALGSDVIFVCVSNDSQTRAAVAGPEGALATAAPGAVIVIHSTVSPQLIQELGEAAHKLKVHIVDAPLTGGVAAAENGTVLYMVGGRPTALKKCLPLLKLSARKIVRAGGPGAGAKAKLVHQLILCGNMLAAREGWVLGQSAGLDPAVLADVIGSGAAQSAIAERLPTMPRDPHNAALFRKDLQLCQDLAAALGVELPGLTLTESQMDIVVMER